MSLRISVGHTQITDTLRYPKKLVLCSTWYFAVLKNQIYFVLLIKLKWKPRKWW